MPKVTIDGSEAECEDGLTIIRAAERLGIEVPHYCWHPGLSIAGNCRMCLVEIEKVPKLQIACNTRVTEGMVVHTANDRVKKAQQAVLEFLLVNHPIDCPICDQAGECKLQDYYMDFDRKPSRFPVEQKVRKRKVVDLGPRVVLDQERCILCLRCTRFLDEVSKTSELGVFERGDRAFIDLAPGKRLVNGYSENVVDICPVGALTSKDFRFKARVWYLQDTESVCTSCARGCSIDIFHREGQMFRFRPRYNPDVNQYWMCDYGRDGYKRAQGPNRLTRPEAREGEGLRVVEWAEASQIAVTRLEEIRRQYGGASVAAIVSARATNEEAFLVRALVDAGNGAVVAGHAWSPPEAPPGDDFLLRDDKTPNRRGLEALDIPTDPRAVMAILDDARAGRVRGLVLFGADLVAELGRERTDAALEGLELLALFASERSETALYADLLLPIGSFAETDGTVTNFEGRVQRLRQAFPAPGSVRPGWAALLSFLESARGATGWRGAEDVFEGLAARHSAFAGLGYRDIEARGALLREPGERPRGNADSAEARP
ncbi:MAG: molybdopterin-dependent oxidoreductase [Candidatus Binatia bacterium]